MSIIFKTLEKIRLQSADKTVKKEGADKYQNNYPLGKIIFSPFTILVCALIIFIMGIMAMYGVRYLKTYVKKKDTLFVSRQVGTKDNRAENSGQENKGKENISGEKEGEIPLPPENVSGEPNQLKSTSFSLKTSNVPVYTEKLRDDFFKKPEIPAGFLKNSSGLHFSPAKEITKISSPSKISNIPNQPVSTVYLPKESRKKPLFLPAAPPEKYKADTKINATKKMPAEQNKKSKIKIFAEKKDALSKLDKKLKINRLIKEIHKFIKTSDNASALYALDELTLLKGEENIYLLKLKAFYYLKNKEYEKAALFLNGVLSINEKDLEAGINMAVVEIGTNQREAAIKRLKKLMDIHPLDSRLPKLILRME